MQNGKTIISQTVQQKRNRWQAIFQCPHGEKILKGEITILIERTVEIRWLNIIKWNWQIGSWNNKKDEEMTIQQLKYILKVA